MRTFILITVLLTAAGARADLIAVYSLTSYDYAARKRFVFEVTREQLLKAPVWRADQDSPPLPLRKADRLATAKFNQIISDTKLWQRKRISLEDMGDGLHWIYVVEFTYTGDIIGGSVPSFRLIVLMDGAVVEPKVLHMEAEILKPH